MLRGLDGLLARSRQVEHVPPGRAHWARARSFANAQRPSCLVLPPSRRALTIASRFDPCRRALGPQRLRQARRPLPGRSAPPRPCAGARRPDDPRVARAWRRRPAARRRCQAVGQGGVAVHAGRCRPARLPRAEARSRQHARARRRSHLSAERSTSHSRRPRASAARQRIARGGRQAVPYRRALSRRRSGETAPTLDSQPRHTS